MGYLSHLKLRDKSTTYLIGKITPLLRDQILQSDRLVRSSIVPLSILTIEAFRGACKRSDDVHGAPVVSGHSPWVRDAFEDGCQHEAMFFAIGTPGGRKFLEDAVV